MRVAIVTGAGSGIGLATANRLFRDGYAVLGVDRSPAGLDALAGMLETDRYASLPLDVTLVEAPAQIMQAALDRFGTVDVLVNNAGIGNSHAVHLTSDEDYDRMLDVNMRSLFRLAREFVKYAQAGAAIVNTSSVYGMRGAPGGGAYSVSKAAVIGFTAQMAAEYGPRGIRVNAVAPGVVATPLIEDRIDQERFRRLIIETVPFNRIGRPEDIAAAIAFLSSNEEAGFVNGHTLVIDGGWAVTHYLSPEALSAQRVPGTEKGFDT